VIYVFDITEKDKEKMEKSLEYWGKTLKCVDKLSPDASIFVLFHKIDDIRVSQRSKIFE
jgi:hypothetical protein